MINLRNIFRSVLAALVILNFMIFIPINNKEVLANSEDQSRVELTQKLASGYSSKFCNAIGIGVSKEGALMLAIAENSKPKFNSSLWFELLKSGKKNLDEIDTDQLINEVSTQVIRDCGPAIELKGSDGIDQFNKYFLSINNNLKKSPEVPDPGD